VACYYYIGGITAKKSSEKMKTAKIQIVIWFFLVVSTLVIYRIISSEMTPTYITEATKEITLEKLRMQKENLRRNDALAFYGEIAALSVLLVCALMISYAYKKKLSVHILELRGAKIPMKEKDLSKALPVVYDLSLAEKMEQTFPEKAFALYEKMAAIRIRELNAITSHGRVATQAALPESSLSMPDVTTTKTPTFRELFHSGQFEEGEDLLCGFDDINKPQHRSLEDLKAVAVAGMQGSGKTLSMAYTVACLMIQQPSAVIYVIDPHAGNKQGLGYILKPLEKTGRLKIVELFEVEGFIEGLDAILGGRLDGSDKTENQIVLVIDEMARLSRLKCFETLLKFIERCTEEIRKARILFIGCSQKWTARHFGGRADIRGCIPSFLVHHTKPSQLKLLLEDAGKEERELLRRVERPGTALLQTSSSSDPSLIHVPLITHADIMQVADFLKVANGENLTSEIFPPVNKCGLLGGGKKNHEEGQPPSNVIKFQRVDKTEVNEKSTAIPHVDQKNEEIKKIIEKLRKDITEKRTTLGEISRKIKVDKSLLSKIVNSGKTELMSENIRRKLCELGGVKIK